MFDTMRTDFMFTDVQRILETHDIPVDSMTFRNNVFIIVCRVGNKEVEIANDQSGRVVVTAENFHGSFTDMESLQDCLESLRERRLSSVLELLSVNKINFRVHGNFDTTKVVIEGLKYSITVEHSPMNNWYITLESAENGRTHTRIIEEEQSLQSTLDLLLIACSYK